MSESEETQSEGEPAEVEEVIEGQFEVNKEGKLVRKREGQPGYTKAEMCVVWHYFEHRYQELYGEGKGSNIAYQKNVAWIEFANAVDAVEGGTKNRTARRVWKKLDNMKYLDWCHSIALEFSCCEFNVCVSVCLLVTYYVCVFVCMSWNVAVIEAAVNLYLFQSRSRLAAMSGGSLWMANLKER